MESVQYRDLSLMVPNPKPEQKIKKDNFNPDKKIAPRCKFGELWELGNHRLLCGDSTRMEDVSKLMDGEKAELLFTSPPYSDMREYNGDKDLSTEYLAKFIPTYAPFANYICVNLGLQTKKKEIVQYWDDYIKAAKEAGLKLMAWNVWNKMSCGAINSVRNFIVPCQHEWIFVFGREYKDINRTVEKNPKNIKKGIIWANVKNNDGTYDKKKKGDQSNPYKKMTSIATISCEHGEILKHHPAPYPVALPSEYIKAFTQEGDIIVDAFGGSGTTIIAAEQLGRRCYAMELDPHYCDVIIARWEKMTGKTAKKIN